MTAAVVVGLVLGFAGGRCAYRPRPLPPAGPGTIDLSAYALTVDPPYPDPWTGLVPHATELPLDVIRRYAVPADTARAAADEERLSWIAGQVTADGVRGAMCIRVDQFGRAVLEDGHHRLEVAPRLGRESWPVEFKPSERITGYGQPVLGLVEALGELVELPEPCGHRSQP